MQFQPFDEEYLRLLRAGDFRTQEHFVRYFTDLTKIKARSRVRSPEAIEDVRQETFVRFFRALQEGKIQHAERLGSFVNSTCNNVLREQFRRVSKDICSEAEEQNDPPDESANPFRDFDAKQRGEKVREILDQLPERDNRLLTEVFLKERDKDEVCAEFGVSREYLRVLLYRAKESFKNLYFKEMGNDDPLAAVRARVDETLADDYAPSGEGDLLNGPH